MIHLLSRHIFQIELKVLHSVVKHIRLFVYKAVRFIMATSETNTGKDSEPDDSISPDGKYERLKEKLGEGAFKQVYKAVDTEEGVTVAWNEADIQALPKTEKKRVIEEVKILQQVEHLGNEIRQIMVRTNNTPCGYHNEILTEGTLKHFTQRQDHAFAHGTEVV